MLRDIDTDFEAVGNAEICFSPDGSRLASANRSALVVCNTETGEIVGKMDEIRENFRSVDWSPDGRRLAAGSDDSVSIWDAIEFRLALKIQLGVDQVRWAPDGLRLAVSYDEKLRILDATHAYQSAGIISPSQFVARPKPVPTIATSTQPPLTARVLTSDQWTWTKPVALPTTVNSPHHEYEPFVTEDGLELYFNSNRPSGQGGYDLYVSRRASLDDQWGAAESAGDIINSPKNEEGAHVSADGLTLYFHSNRDGSNDMFVAKRSTHQEAWGQPKRLPTPVNSDSSDGEPTISHDGQTLLFVSTRSNKFEIFMAQRESVRDDWSSPIRLGNKINSAQWQGSPSILADDVGSVVIFHSIDGAKILSRSSASDRFSAPEPAGDASKLGSVYSPFLWKDGRTLYYRRPQGDQYDIWMSKRIKK